MSYIYSKYVFIFCSEDQASDIINQVEELSDNAKAQNIECRYDYDPYDRNRGGIMVSYQKRNDKTDDYRHIESKYRTLWMTLGDGDESYTNDFDHEVFPKFIMDGIDYRSGQEITNALEEIGITYDSTEHDPDGDPEEFVSWIHENEDEFNVYIDYIYDAD